MKSGIPGIKMGPYRVWTRRQLLAFMAGVAGTSALNACQSQESGTPNASPSASASQSASPSSRKIEATMGIVIWVGYVPLWIAEEKGFFKEKGLDLTFKTFGTNPDGLAAFRAGKIDGWASVPSEAVLLAANRKDYRIVMVADQSLGADGILARNKITSIQDFKGKTIAVEEGAVSHFFLLQVLKSAGLTGKDVKLVNTSPDAAAAAYQVGKVDIAVTYAPFLAKANAAQKDGRIIYDSSKIPWAIVDFYLFDTQFLEKYPQAAEAYVKGVFKGLEFLKTNPKEAYAIAALRLGITAQEVEDTLKQVRLADLATNTEMLGNPQSDLYLMKSLQQFTEFLKDQKQIQQSPDLSKVLDPKFVQAAGKVG